MSMNRPVEESPEHGGHQIGSCEREVVEHCCGDGDSKIWEIGGEENGLGKWKTNGEHCAGLREIVVEEIDQP